MWATESDVLSITGRAVDAETLAVAVSVIHIYSNRTPEASGSMGVRDLYWMKQATAWQAAWLPDQPGYTGRSNFESMSQDGLSVKHGADWQQELAPLAARSLRNCSWMGEKSTNQSNVLLPVVGHDFTLESSDDATHWQPL